MSPMIAAALLLDLMCAMMKINSEHAQKFTPRLNKGRGWRLNNQICSFEHCNGLVLYFIANSYLLLACFSVGFLYILVQNLLFSMKPHNPKNSVENVYKLVQKCQSGSTYIPFKKLRADI